MPARKNKRYFVRTAGRPRWKYGALVLALGPDDVLQQRIRAEGFTPPPLKTIAGWRLRDAVPGVWAPLLIDLALRDNRLDGLGQLRKP